MRGRKTAAVGVVSRHRSLHWAAPDKGSAAAGPMRASPCRKSFSNFCLSALEPCYCKKRKKKKKKERKGKRKALDNYFCSVHSPIPDHSPFLCFPLQYVWARTLLSPLPWERVQCPVNCSPMGLRSSGTSVGDYWVAEFEPPPPHDDYERLP